MSAKRGLALAVLGCVVGSCVVLLALTRIWTSHVLPAPPPLGISHVTRSGSAVEPWLRAVALVALAGAGALLATRGGARALIGVLITLAGLGLAVSGGYGIVGVANVYPGWPGLCLLAGLLVAAAGLLTVVRGRSWPAMGARYERPAPILAPREPVEDQVQRIGPSPSDVAMWDALDRGEDPSR